MKINEMCKAYQKGQKLYAYYVKTVINLRDAIVYDDLPRISNECKSCQKAANRFLVFLQNHNIPLTLVGYFNVNQDNEKQFVIDLINHTENIENKEK